MKAFDRLVEISQQLLGPGGCPWDQKQTMESLRSTVLEETCELIEAVDLKDSEHIREELGDLMWNVIFYAMLAEKNGMFTMEEFLEAHSDKLVRRHPHVFGDQSAESAEDALNVWEAQKAQEHGDTRKHPLDGLPKGLPALLLTYKMAKRLKRAGGLPTVEGKDDAEWEVGRQLFALATQAQADGIDPENALRRVLAEVEADARQAV